MWNKYKPYVGFIALSLGVGALAAFFTRNNMDIYNDIITPPLSPPMWSFGVVWSILYILMGISAAMVYKERYELLSIFYVQLAANFLWSIVFFNLRWFLFSSIWLILLLALIIIMIRQFKRVSKTAAYLQIPYILWVAFALYLNIAIWWLNK